MRRLGFTLIEVLLAIALLIAVLSLVGPALFDRIAPRTFDDTADRLAAEIRLAREDARRTGELRLIYAARSNGTVRLESRRTPPASDAFGQDAAMPFDRADFGARGRPSASGSGGFGDMTNADPSEDEETPRELAVLPAGFDLVHTRPAFLESQTGPGPSPIGGLTDGLDSEFGDDADLTPFGDDADGDFAAAMDRDGIGGLGFAPESVLIAVCVPDGTVLPARTTWMTDDGERAARLIINSASGIIRFETEVAARDAIDDMDEFGIGPDEPRSDAAPRPTNRRSEPETRRPNMRTRPTGGRP